MKKISFLLSLFLFSTFFISCDSDNSVIDNSKEEWFVLLASGEANPKLSIVQMPENEIIIEDIFQDQLSMSLNSPISKIYVNDGFIYVFQENEYKVTVIEEEAKNTFALRETFDFSDEELIPSEICFPNSTEAYLCHGNSKYVSLIDTKNFQVSKKIEVGFNPVSICYAENKVFVANQKGNSVYVISTPAHAVVDTFKVGIAPVAVRANNKLNKVIVASKGYGRIDEEKNTDAYVSFHNIDSYKEGRLKKVEYGIYKSNEIDITDIQVSTKNVVFVQLAKGVLRINSDREDRFYFVFPFEGKALYTSTKNDEMWFLANDESEYSLFRATKYSGDEIAEYPLSGRITAICQY